MQVFIFFAYVYLVNAEIYSSKDKVRRSNVGDNINNEKNYTSTWIDLDSRPLPEWYDRDKIGILITWGVYSVPGIDSEWFWKKWTEGKQPITDFMKKNYRPGFTYQEFAPMFKAEFFNPLAWAVLFAEAGAKYVVLSSKHHDGFNMFPSKRSFSWNSVDVGPKRDIVGELENAVRSSGMRFGVYYSLYEWFHPMYNEDKKMRFKQQNYVQTKLLPDIKQLVVDYKPSILWADGDWEAPFTYWGSLKLLAWLYNESPVNVDIVVNDRWGTGTNSKHGDFYTYTDYESHGTLQARKRENVFTMDSLSFGYRKNMRLNEVISVNEILYQVVSTVSCGGNVLINVGATREGTIPLIFQERLLSLGTWLSINGDAIYNTSPWYYQRDSLNNHVWYTCRTSEYNVPNPTSVPRDTDKVIAVYVIILDWPIMGSVEVKDIMRLMDTGIKEIKMLGNEGQKLSWKLGKGIVSIELPDFITVKSKHAWVLNISF